MREQNNLIKLLRSKSWKVQALGGTVFLFFLLPDAFRIIGDPDLTVWNRLEQISISIGQTLIPIAIAAVDPSELVDSEDD